MGTGYMGMDETPVVEHDTTQTETTPQAEATAQNEPVTTTTTTEPAATTEPEKIVVTEPEPRVIEKVVEKIVEKYPEFKDERAKDLYERYVNGDIDSIHDYLSEIKRNYDTMSDLDVVRMSLKKDNPTWTDKDIELEIRTAYGKQLEVYDLDSIDKDLDPEGYKEALAHNERAEENLLRLQRGARDSRVKLKEQQKTIELPKITKEEPVAQTAGRTQEEIDESNRKWAEDAETSVPNITDFKFQIGDDKKPEEAVFTVTPEDKAELVESMKKWNGADFMKERGWTNEDGTFNHLKIAEDVYALRNLNKIVKSVSTRSKNATIKEVIASDIKNIDLSNNRAETVDTSSKQDVGDLIWS